MQTDKPFGLAALVSIIFLTLLYLYFAAVIAPLRHKLELLQSKLDIAQSRFASDSARLRQLIAEEEAEKQNAALDRLFKRLCETLPHPAIVACPSRLSKLMARYNIAGTRIRLLAFLHFPGTSEFVINCWKIYSPSAPPLALGQAFAELECQLPMAQISDIQIRRDPSTGFICAEFDVQIPALR